MSVKLELICAVCENMGIGKNNNLPWRLKTEMDYFTRMTKSTIDSNKMNVVIMGRKTWDSIPAKYKPLEGRINFILSKSDLDLHQYNNCYAFKSLNETINNLICEKFHNKFERVWVIGGSNIYKEAMGSKYFHRLYLTKIMKKFDCDTFFPEIDETKLKEVKDVNVPEGIQEEKGIKFVYHVYETVKQ